MQRAIAHYTAVQQFTMFCGVVTVLLLSLIIGGAPYFLVKFVAPSVQSNPLNDEVIATHTEYVHLMESTWAAMPEGKDRQKCEQEWRERYAKDMIRVYRKYGKSPPDWCNRR